MFSGRSVFCKNKRLFIKNFFAIKKTFFRHGFALPCCYDSDNKKIRRGLPDKTKQRTEALISTLAMTAKTQLISSFQIKNMESAEMGVNYDDAQKITESIGNRTDDQFFQHLFRNGYF